MRRRLTFHIGLEKTGTDSFQRFCTEQHEVLRSAGTLYPTRSVAFGAYNHEPLVACYLDYRDFSIRSSRRDRSEVLGSLRAEIAAADAPAVLISGEHFSSRFREAEIRQLGADFSGFDCRIAVVVREHRARLFSAYSQAVLSGRDMTLDAYCDEVFDRDNPYMRYAETIGMWEAVFGSDNIGVLRHSRGRDMIPVLCAALIAADFPLNDSRGYWDNLSVGPRATEWLRRINRAINRLPGASHPAMRAAMRGPRRDLARFLAKLAGQDDKTGWRLGERDERRLNEIAAADDAWLQRHYGIALHDEAPEPVTASG